MTTDTILDLIAAILLLFGGILTLAAGVGLVRFPDAPSRLHASTKPQVLGLVLVVIALALSARSWSVLLMLIPVIVFQLITVPISAHIVARAAYRMGNFRKDLIYKDELAAAIEQANDEGSSRQEAPAPPP
ncbi:MAG: monovalent cation/H(+) antiporter subunit G [Rhodoglobus sp.]